MLTPVLELINDPVTPLEQCWMPSSLTSNLHVFSWKRSSLSCGREVYVGLMVRPGLRARARRRTRALFLAVFVFVSLLRPQRLHLLEFPFSIFSISLNFFFFLLTIRAGFAKHPTHPDVMKTCDVSSYWRRVRESGHCLLACRSSPGRS